MTFPRGLLWVAFLMAIANASARAAEAPADAPGADQSIYLPPLPAVVKYAVDQGIPIQGIELADRAEEARPGDAVVLLITSYQVARYEQWLVCLQTEPLTESDREKKPPNDIVLYTITGDTLRYPGSWSAVGIRVIGPFAEDGRQSYFPSLEDRRGHALVRTCLFILLTRSKLKHPGEVDDGSRIDPSKVLTWASKPFNDDQIVEGRRLAAQIGMTSEDERLIGGVAPALAAFLRVVEKAPDLPEMAIHVLEIPSVWSILREGRLESDIALQSVQVGVIADNPWNLPVPVYRLPFELRINDQPVLDCTLAVAEPRRPLLTCAGILGIAASKPSNRERRLSVRVIATRATP